MSQVLTTAERAEVAAELDRVAWNLPRRPVQGIAGPDHDATVHTASTGKAFSPCISQDGDDTISKR